MGCTKLCKLWNKVGRLFLRLEGCRRICTRFDKLDVKFLAFSNFAPIIEMNYDLV